MDIVDRETRSRMMSGIRGRDTRPESLVRSYLHRAGLRYRLGGCGLPGRPDLVMPGRRVVVFVHGCFWHRHEGCRFASVPSTRAEFWREKFASNVRRDEQAISALVAMGWTPLTIWECEAESGDALDQLFWKIVANCQVQTIGCRAVKHSSSDRDDIG